MTQAAWESAAPKFKPTDSEVGAREQVVRQPASPHRLRYCDLTGRVLPICLRAIGGVGPFFYVPDKNRGLRRYLGC